MIFNPDYLRFISLLNKHVVAYLIVGGYAVNYHGYVRSTFDLDVWVNNTNKNIQRLIAAIEEFGYDANKLKSISFKDTIVFHFGDEKQKIEILSQIIGVSFDDADSKKEVITIENVVISILDLNSLLRNKLLSGRYKDWDDYEKLTSE